MGQAAPQGEVHNRWKIDSGMLCTTEITMASLRRAAMQVVSRDLEVRTGALGTRAELIGAAALCTAHLHGDVPASLAAPGWQRLEARA